MLRRDVVEAAEQGLFRIYPVTHIDQGLSLLTGVTAGEADAEGISPGFAQWPGARALA